MSWTNFFDGIYVLNLRHRTDRLLHITEEMEKYDIGFELVTSIENENGAEGLRQTVVKLFSIASAVFISQDAFSFSVQLN